MTFENILAIAVFAQLASGLISISAYVPQIIHLHRTRSVAGISLSSWYLWQIGSGCAFFYAAVHYIRFSTGMELVLSTGVSFFFNLILITLALRYR